MTKFLLALSLLLSIPAHAFVFIDNGGYNLGARPVANAPVWSGRKITFVVNTDQNTLGGSISPELSSAQFQSAIASAAAAWNSVCGSDVAIVISGTNSLNRDSSDLVNTIFWENRTTAGGNMVGDTNVLAQATPSVSGSDRVLDCDIVVNGEATGTFGIDGSSSLVDLVGVLVHEMGHCLGLGHTVASPTYTSTNTILLNAVMAATVSAGDISKRTLSQDEIDAMECVNPKPSSGYSARKGKYCTSYHGTNGGAALSGTVSGGPSSSRTCTDSTSFTASSSSGGGCVTKAIADDGSETKDFTIGWTILFPLLYAILFFGKKLRKWLTIGLLVFLLPGKAFSALEVSYGLTRAAPASAKTASALNSSDGTFTSTTTTQNNPFTNFQDIYVAASQSYSDHRTWGLFFKKNLDSNYDTEGSSSGVVQFKKQSALYGWTTGLVGKFFLDPKQSRLTNFFFEFQIGAGKSKYFQKVTDSSSNVSTILATAFAVEANAYLGSQFPIWGMLDGLIKIGYSRLHTNYYSVSETTGSRFSSLKSGDRLALLTSGEDFQLKRDGVSAQIGLTFSLGGGYGGGGGGGAPSAPGSP